MRAWPVATLAAAVLAACGGSGPAADETGVRHAVNRWIAAIGRHDGGAACAQLSTALQQRIERHLAGEGVRGNCRTWAARWISPRHPASHRGARITAIRIRGAHATVSLAAAGVPDGRATLVREGGRWRIDDY